MRDLPHPEERSKSASRSTHPFPRTLFITGAAFNHVTGGGITFSNLFRGWPKSAIATVHNDAMPVSDDVCARYYRLGSAEIDTWPMLRRFRRREATGAAATEVAEASPGLLHRAKSLVFGDGLPERGRISPSLEVWIADFRPELLYTILGGIGMMEVIAAVQRRFALPMVVHVMDDWQAAIHRGGLLSPWQRLRMRRLFADLVGRAAIPLGIGEAMCAEYGARYGRPFRAFQNTVDTRRWALLAKQDLAPGRPVRLLYAGSIFAFAQSESLADCAASVLALNRAGGAFTLDIYSAPGQRAGLARRFAGKAAIAFHDVIADDEAYFRSLAAADILLLPVNFDPHSVRYIRLSMPTKVPSYLVSGTPVLVYGPPGVAQIDYARHSGWGHVVSERHPPALQSALRRLAEDMALRHTLSRRAQEVAAERHDSATVRAGFQATLAEAAEALHGE